MARKKKPSPASQSEPETRKKETSTESKALKGAKVPARPEAATRSAPNDAKPKDQAGATAKAKAEDTQIEGKSLTEAEAEDKSQDMTEAQTATPLVVGVGASAGGLEAFTDLLRHLPRNTGMAFVLIQHLPAKQRSMLAQILGKATVLPVNEVHEGMVPEADHVYILPPGAIMELRQGALRLENREITEGRYLPVDTFLISLAKERGAQAIGVILSGTASDGVQGMKAIKEVGGITFAQDEHTAKYSGMPQSSIAAGYVDFILGPQEIAKELSRLARNPYIGPGATELGLLKPGEEGLFIQILNLLKRSTGVDFTYYKQNTLKRRILRRMAIRKTEDLQGYLTLLKSDPEEVSALYADILINVTSFFRDQEVFDELKKTVFPALMQEKNSNSPIRIWVPGCATGEEVYSLAISLLEFLNEVDQETPFQIFGTDIDNAATEVARSGRYRDHVLENVSPQRLQRFFARVDSGYQIQKSIRDRCTFARQNLIKDPPFSHLDLISCRNVLIYLGPVLQKRIIPIFHFALKEGGYLLLGKSEAIDAFQEMFTLADKRYKIYLKKDLPGRLPLKFTVKDYAEHEDLSVQTVALEETVSSLDLNKEADRIILARFAPAGVIVDENFIIQQFRGRTGPFLEPMPGEASLNLLRMVRESLRSEVGAALYQVVKGETPVRREGLKLTYSGRELTINLEVFPVSPIDYKERFYLVIFEDVTPAVSPEPEKSKAAPRKGKTTPKDGRIHDLEQELAATKDYLQTTIEAKEATLEELKSTNEEIMSFNEELQSLNEELEASREELQSANEELATVNEELENRNTELTQVNDDLVNLLGSINLPILFLDQKLRIRRFNAKAQDVLHLIPADVGRSLEDIKIGLNIENLETLLRMTIHTLQLETREVQDDRGRWYNMQIKPYKTEDNKIEGLVLSLADISDLKASLKRAEEARNYAQAIVETLREPLLVLNGDLRLISANQAFYEFFKIHPQEAEDHLVYELGSRQFDLPELRSLLEEILPRDTVIQDFQVDREIPGIGRQVLILNARRLRQDRGPDLILLAVQDITVLKEAEIALQESERKLRVLNAELMSSQESERQSLALVLHEELAQNLVALKLKLRKIAAHLPAESSEDSKNLNQVMQSLNGLVEEARELSVGLRPQVLDLGLVPAIRHLVEHFNQYFQIDASYEVPDLNKLLAPQTQVMVYRVLQEALVNVVKHAQASKVSLKVEKQDNEVEFQVIDNGIGFRLAPDAGADLCEGIQASPDKAWLVGGVPFIATNGGRKFKAAPEALGAGVGRKMGLALMEGRIRLLGGTFQISSEQDKGTKVTVAVPIDGN